MSPTLRGFPYFEVQFRKDGAPADVAETDAVRTFLAASAVTDLIVFSHGWNNDVPEARALLDRFFSHVRSVADGGSVPLAGRSFAIVAVLWPSKRFSERDRVAGGAASLGAPEGTAALAAQLDDLQGVFDDPAADGRLEQAKTLLAEIEFNPAAQRQFADLIRSMLPRDGEEPDDDASDQFFAASGDELIGRLGRPVLPGPPSGPGGGAASLDGGAAAFNPLAGAGQFVSGVRAGAERLLNYATYWQMKNRAGLIGRGGVNALLRDISAAQPSLKLHLVGHSFGGRLVTAAVLGPAGAAPLRPASLTLLQAAFSHYAFAQRYDAEHDGFFRAVVAGGRVTGPIVVTCTANDEAVGILYPLASMIAGQVASALGDRNDPFGGMGRNGAQKTPEATDGKLLAMGGDYRFAAGAIFNLSADAVIKNHSDIAHDEVAYALLRAVAVT